MRAVVIEAFGPPDVLKVKTVPDPTPVGNQVLVRVGAAGIDRHDLHLRAGQFKFQTGSYRQPLGAVRLPVPLPIIPGAELAGTIVAMGPQASGFTVGQRVTTLPHINHCGKCALCRNGHEEGCPASRFLGHDVDGGCADYVIVTDGAIVPTPDNVADEAACLGGACIGVAVRAVYDNVKPHDVVVVTGAGGGLGVFAVQVAALRGARVIAVTTSPGKAAKLTALGASDVVVASRDKPGTFHADVLAMTKGTGANVVIDLVGGDALSSALKCVAPYGRIVLVGDVAEKAVPIHPSIVFLKGLTIATTTSATLTYLRFALELLAQNRLICPIQVFPLEQTDRAHEAVEGASIFGRAVVVP